MRIWHYDEQEYHDINPDDRTLDFTPYIPPQDIDNIYKDKSARDLYKELIAQGVNNYEASCRAAEYYLNPRGKKYQQLPYRPTLGEIGRWR